MRNKLTLINCYFLLFTYSVLTFFSFFQAYYFIKNAFQWKRKYSASSYKLLYISNDIDNGTFIGILSWPVSIHIQSTIKTVYIKLFLFKLFMYIIENLRYTLSSKCES